ncbi:TRAP transporter large permease [Anaerotruncus rubiinfantis]|uniref:TRAP transporter large permease n=1 Tax=Anaerotruncus rubiinfantis TaxID=1720200 RepID=UPI0008303AA8|nr:TRAP transporter large permease [Anaerotruncus rubiinfantis]
MFMILILFIVFFLGLPIGFALGIVSTVQIVQMGVSMNMVTQRLFSGIDSTTLTAVLLFTLAGSLMMKGGMSDRLISFADALVGHLPSGMAMVSVLACMFFAALTGAAVAAAAAIGGIMIPVMLEKGYDKGFTSSLLATASSIGPIIPPSIPLLIYGVIASCSVAKLFIGGIIPGILMGVSLMAVSYFVGKKRGYIGRPKRATAKEIFTAAKSAVFALLIPVIILGGIMSGIFTATESASIAVVYALLIGIFIYKTLPLREILASLIDASKTTGMVLLVVGFASLFTWVISMQMLPARLTELMSSVIHSKYLFLLVVNVILLIAGTFIDTTSAVLIFSPLFLPMAQSFGIDPIHLGVVIAVNLSIGMCTPPLGVCLFVTSGITQLPLKGMFRDLIPQLAALVIVLLIITYFPWTVTALPALVA